MNVRETRKKPPSIPSESDWGDYRSDLDQKWAHDQYCGRSNDEMQKYFRNNPIEAFSDLEFMPEIPFRYYMLGYRDFVISGKFDHLEGSDAASCFLNLVLLKLEKQPRFIAPIMDDLLDALEHVAQHQKELHANENIYGSFPEKLARIKTLYSDIGDRYRRYP